MWVIKCYNDKVYKEIKKFPKDVDAKTISILGAMKIHGPLLGHNDGHQWEKDIWEITANAKAGWGRVLYIAVQDNTIWLLYSYLKKTNETPKQIAQEVRKRAKEVKNASK